MGQGDSLRDRVEDADSGTGVDDDKLLELAEWTYKNVEEVWSGFNLIADTVARGARVRGHDTAEAWGEDVDVQEKVRMMVVNALVYGRCVCEAGQDFLKVRNPRNITIEQDDEGEITSVVQEIDAEQTPADMDLVLPPEPRLAAPAVADLAWVPPGLAFAHRPRVGEDHAVAVGVLAVAVEVDPHAAGVLAGLLPDRLVVPVEESPASGQCAG